MRGHIGAASTLLSQYLAMKPSDIEAKEQFSKLLVDHLGKTAALERAFRINEDLLRDRISCSTTAAPSGSARDSHAAIFRRGIAPEGAAFRDARLSQVWYLSGRVAEEMRKPDAAKGFYNCAVQSLQPVPEAFAGLVESV